MPLALEHVDGLDHALVDGRLVPEELRERLRRLARALERRADERRDGPPDVLDVQRRGGGHPVSLIAQDVTRQPAVEHAAGVVNLPVAHEM